MNWFKISDVVGKAKTIAQFFITLWYSIIDGLISFSNKQSRNFRLVSKKLQQDLKSEKSKLVVSSLTFKIFICSFTACFFSLMQLELYDLISSMGLLPISVKVIFNVKGYIFKVK